MHIKSEDFKSLKCLNTDGAVRWYMCGFGLRASVQVGSVDTRQFEKAWLNCEYGWVYGYTSRANPKNYATQPQELNFFGSDPDYSTTTQDFGLGLWIMYVSANLWNSARIRWREQNVRWREQNVQRRR